MKRRNSSLTREENSSDVIVFGSTRRSTGEIWDTSFFFSILFELFDEFRRRSTDETRLVAFLVDRLNEIQLNSSIPIRLSVDLLKYFREIRLKILVFVEILNLIEKFDCQTATIFLDEFASFGSLTLFYVLDRLKFSLIDRTTNWKCLIKKFSSIESQKHVAFILFDQKNFYKVNRASIRCGSKIFDRLF